jgi:hypothetical protein
MEMLFLISYLFFGLSVIIAYNFLPLKQTTSLLLFALLF